MLFLSSSELKVGDILYVEKGSRVPADMVLLRTTEHSGSCFIRTDQLDGETDWKLKGSCLNDVCIFQHPKHFTRPPFISFTE